MKKLFFLLLLLASFGAVKAQTVTPIADIVATGNDLLAPNDTSLNFNGEEVTIRGVILNNPNEWYLIETSQRSSFFIQDTVFPYAGIEVTVTDETPAYTNLTQFGTGYAGSLVQVTGRVGYFSGLIQLDLDDSDNPNLQVIEQNFGARPDSVLTTDGNVGLLNNQQEEAQTTGHFFEGKLVTIEDVTVSAVAAQAERGRFTVQDAGGNTVTIFDAVDWMRNTPGNPFSPAYNKPAIGTVYGSITGVVRHFSFDDGEPGNYVIVPLTPADLDVTASPPVIDQNSISRSPVCPAPTDDVTITVVVEHPEEALGTDSTETVTLVYNAGGSDVSLTMTETAVNSNTYEATIPASELNEGVLVYYYVTASDFSGESVSAPQFTPPAFTARAAGCRIRDIQRVPDFTVNPNFTDSFYESGYTGLTVVNVPGIVASTAGSNGLGRVHLIENGVASWGGIKIVGGGNDLLALNVGDSVTVTGLVVDGFDADSRSVTEINISSGGVNVESTGNTVVPVIANAATFTDNGEQMTYALEPFESMFVRFEESGLVVVNDAVDTAGNSPHEGDYRVGTDELDPATGVRVAAGSDGGSTFSSLNVSYVRDADLETVNGQMNVTPCVVQVGTTMDFVQGIIGYQFNRIKLLPRTNEDFGTVENTVEECTIGREDLVSNAFTMYPNPTNGKLNFTFTGEAAADSYTAQVFDMTGRTLVNTELRAFGNAAELDLSALQAGSYVVVLTSNTGARMSKPVIIQ